MIDASSPRQRRSRKGRPSDSLSYSSVGEDVASSIATGVGAALAIAAIPLTVVKSVNDGGGMLLGMALAYSVSMTLWLLFSVLRHAMQLDGPRHVFEVLDHCFGHLFSAASCAPYFLLVLDSTAGPIFFVAAWVVSIAGLLLELLWRSCPRLLTVATFLIPWILLLAFTPQLYAVVSGVYFWLLVVGAVLCAVGLLFDLLGRQVPYLHFVFHVLVVFGLTFMFFPMFLVVL